MLANGSQLASPHAFSNSTDFVGTQSKQPAGPSQSTAPLVAPDSPDSSLPAVPSLPVVGASPLLGPPLVPGSPDSVAELGGSTCSELHPTTATHASTSARTATIVTDINSHNAVRQTRKLLRTHPRRSLLVRRLGLSRFLALLQDPAAA